MMRGETPARRDFLAMAAAAGVILVNPSARAAQPQDKDKDKKSGGEDRDKDKGTGEEDVTPGEDLMQEHGLLKRVMLIYEESIRRLRAKEDIDPQAIADAAGLIRSFVEDYHEKLEENYLFPRLRKANVEVELVATLLMQHIAGRRVTDRTMHLATAASLKNEDDRRALIESLESFNRMYAPHEAREDTVLFPAFRKILSANEYSSLGEEFEKEEHKAFGQDGFEMNVAKVAAIEKRLGIYDLGQFTPKI